VLVTLLLVLLGVAAVMVGHRLGGMQVALLVGGVLGAVLFTHQSYHRNWTWTGFCPSTVPKDDQRDVKPGKTLWDWLQLFIIPTVLALVAFALNEQQQMRALQASQAQHKSDTAMALDQDRESVLNTYMDRMSDLLLSHKLPQDHTSCSRLSNAARDIAQARTITAMRRLDGRRNGFLLTFVSKVGVDLCGTDLSEIDLREATASDANLRGADLTRAELRGAKLSRANLSGAILNKANLKDATLDMAHLSQATLSGADLRGAHLSGADLREAILYEAHLRKAILSGADLRGAYLTEADLTRADLRGAKLLGANLSEANLSDANLLGATGASLKDAASLQHAIMPDGTVHP
jgi:uncharacterized protein YjbI with pentapeptide repeats